MQLRRKSGASRKKKKTISVENKDKLEGLMLIQASDKRWQRLVKNISDIILSVSREGKILEINHTVSGMSAKGVIGKSIYDYISPKYHKVAKRALECVFRTGRPDNYEVLGTGFRGPETAWYDTRVLPIKNNGRVLSVTLISKDITQRKETEEALRESEKRFRDISENAHEWIWETDTDGRYTYASPVVEKILGYKPEEIVHKRYFYDLFHPSEREKLVKEAMDIFSKKQPFREFINLNIHKNGRPVWLCTSGVPLFDEQGIFIGYRGADTDITERKRAEQKLEKLNRELLRTNKKLKQLALRDPQTGLYNHRYFEEVIEAEFYRAKRYAHPLSVIMLDIDYFKSINDVYGHQFGDLVLKQLARLLRRLVRRYDIVTRFDGEEFVIICPGADGSQAYILAQRLLDAINLYSFGDKRQSVELKLSIAVASYPEDKIVEGMDLIKVTEQILNEVKEQGGNRVYSSADTKKKKRSPLSKNAEDFAEIKFLKEKIYKLNKKANQNLIESVFAFAKTIKLKDRYTGEHVERIVHYTTEIARALNLPKDEIERIKQASILHDLGKIGIGEKVLLKKSKLNRREYDEIKRHPQIGVDIIRPIQFLHSIIPLILYHHERWDGAGYPRGLKGEEIPIGARIVAIADVYQSLISDRPYRKAYPKEKAVEIIKRGSGTQFDPQIVNVFLKILT